MVTKFHLNVVIFQANFQLCVTFYKIIIQKLPVNHIRLFSSL